MRLSTFLDFGGIESKMVNLASYNDTENEWVFVALGKGGSAEKKIQLNGKRAIGLNLNHKIPNPFTIFKLFLFFKREMPDVLHTSGAEANFFGFIAGKFAGIRKIVVEEIGIPSHSSYAKKIFSYIFRNADWAVGESELVVEHFRNSLNLKPAKTRVVHNFGVFNYDISKVFPQKNGEVFQVIMISRLVPVKNIEGVLDVLAKLLSEGFKLHLTLAGTGNSENVLRQKVQALKLDQNVSLIGFVSDPYPFLLNSDLYILNSFSEGFSNSLVEAMYSKTPSLSTAVGAAPEIIIDGENGFLVPAHHDQFLYDKLKMIMNLSVEKRAEIGEKGHQVIVNNFSLEHHMAKLMEIYRD